MSYMLGLKCRECGRLYPKEVIFVCEYCFGGVEVDYDYDAIRRVLTKDAGASRPKSLWRYRELLPIEGEPAVGLLSGFTPFFRSERLAQRLGVEELYLKDDSVSHPTLSFKDRVVSVAALSARAGLQRYIFIPSDLEMGKVVGSLIYRPTLVAVEGTYDDVNRLCAEIGSKYPWAVVHINIR